jgi:hypothetical protein
MPLTKAPRILDGLEFAIGIDTSERGRYPCRARCRGGCAWHQDQTHGVIDAIIETETMVSFLCHRPLGIYALRESDTKRDGIVDGLLGISSGGN